MNTFLHALHADGPAGPHAAKLMLFGRFVGSWMIEWSDGGSVRATGELHFGWVLGGRAVQDIWNFDAAAAFPRLDDPVLRPRDRGVAVDVDRADQRPHGRFIGRPVGDEIVLLSDEEAPLLRWRFSDIQPDSFTWSGEISHDGGVTWAFDQQMLATRADMVIEAVGV